MRFIFILFVLLGLRIAIAVELAVDDSVCAEIIDDTRRLKCYDEVFGKRTPATEDQAVGGSSTAVEQRAVEIARSRRSKFSLTPYRLNYLLPFAYNTSPNEPAFQLLRPGDDMDRAEAKFQISLEFDIKRSIFSSNYDLYFGYTQLAWWQVFNQSASKPFRETNYEPEIGLRINPQNKKLLGLNFRQARFGIVHQSNGRGDPLSRSWNRIYGIFILDKGNFVTVFRPWYRIPNSTSGDENPDITDFLGYFEWYAFYKWKRQTFGFMLRNNLKAGGNRGAVQFDWSYPLNDKLKFYLQYFNGYGESLIDYNDSTHRVGIGIMLSDWL
ncbi:MAG: phospholipase A [Gammaproteobacteria bacterium]|nr:phospholipase A [Gammaproteobacteria bacterium]